VDSRPPDADTDSHVSVADLLRREGYDPGPELEWQDLADPEPMVIDQPPPPGRLKRVLVAGGAVLATASVLAIALIIGTTGDQADSDRIAQPVPGPAAPPATSLPAVPLPSTPDAEVDEPTERAAAEDDDTEDERAAEPETVEAPPAAEQQAPPPAAPPAASPEAPQTNQDNGGQDQQQQQQPPAEQGGQQPAEQNQNQDQDQGGGGEPPAEEEQPQLSPLEQFAKDFNEFWGIPDNG
jgi:hypothetical protein